MRRESRIPDLFRALLHESGVAMLILLATVLLAVSGSFGTSRVLGQSGGAARVSAGAAAKPGASGHAPVPATLPSTRLSQSGAGKPVPARTTCLLQSSRSSGTTDMIEILVELTGTIGESGADGAESGKLETVAGFRYEEKTLSYGYGAKPELSALRAYEQAGAKRSFGGEIKRTLLDASRRYQVARFNGERISLFSPSGPMKSEQLLLLEELPFNSLLLDQLLPNRTVKVGEQWPVPDAVAVALCGLEVLEHNTVRCVLSAITDDMAEVELFLDGGRDEKGEPLPSTLVGASLGSSVAMELEGRFQFDLKTRRMTWLGAKITDTRSASLVEPALTATASVRIKIAPVATPSLLTQDVLDEVKTDWTPELDQLVYTGQNGPWRFRHGRQWRMVEDNEKSAALCLIIAGEGIAQCNILLNQKVEEGAMPTREVYKDELKKGLGDQFGTFVRDTEFKDENDNVIYSVIVDGQHEGVPFRWIYYLFTAPDGRQATVMFEVKADLLDRFNEQGEEISGSFEFVR
ncbi:MAG: hypothetical protein Q4G68_02355 [Planctomycetia bacterium]|nr:hypothetical protein [Planctomycetia bacterium]